jgi:hypothetical protein
VNDKAVSQPPSTAPDQASAATNSVFINGTERAQSLKNAEKEPQKDSSTSEKEGLSPQETTIMQESKSLEGN